MIIYQEYATQEAAEMAANQLTAAGIATIINKVVPKAEEIYLGTDYRDRYILSINQADFPQANNILFDSIDLSVEEVDSNDPLLSMTDHELLQVLAKPDEWGQENYITAKAILKGRGNVIKEEQLNELKERRIKELAATKSFNPSLLFLGYLCGIANYFYNYANITRFDNSYESYFLSKVVVSALPAFFGIFIGGAVLLSRNTLPNGRRVVVFSKRSLLHGKVIVVFNVVSWLLFLLLSYTLKF